MAEPTLKFHILLGGATMPYEFPWGSQAGLMLGFGADGQFALLDPATAINAISETEKGAPNGVATLGVDGKHTSTEYRFGGLGDPAGPLDGSQKIPSSQIPAPSTFGAVATVATASIVYGTAGANVQTTYAVGQTSAQPNTIVQRDGAGAIQTALPTAVGHATTKGYVDTADDRTPTSTVRGGVLQQAAIANIGAAPTQADFNALLAAARAAGWLAT